MSNTEPPRPPPSPPEPASGRRKRWPWFAGIAGVLVVALGVGVWYFVFHDDAPPAVSLADATESVKERATVTTEGSKSQSGSDSLSGTWKIDTTIGDFSDFTSAFVGYRVQEELARIGAKTAVGRTPDVSGSLTLDDTTITAVEITVDMTTLQSDDSNRDGQMAASRAPDLTVPDRDVQADDADRARPAARRGSRDHGRRHRRPHAARRHQAGDDPARGDAPGWCDRRDRVARRAVRRLQHHEAHELLGALRRGSRDHRAAAVLQPFLGFGSAISSTHSPRSNA